MSATPLPPGSTIGILGGGQLGRMLALDAARMGYRCHIYCPEASAPAAEVAAAATVAAYDDAEALAAFAVAVDLVTYEFENVPAATAATLAAKRPVEPSPKVLEICQNRLKEKRFLTELGLRTAPFAAVDSLQDLQAGLAKVGTPAVLKTTQFGYDGKGQRLIEDPADAAAAFADLGRAALILEGFVTFAYEASVLVARNALGEVACYPLVENRHRDHILQSTHVPAPASAETAEAAEDLARRIAEGLELRGLIGVELFVLADGGLLVNEMAPRPHNSGHWTIDAAVTSQFEQCLRALCGLPLGSAAPLGPAVMENLLGNQVERWMEILADPRAKLHLYGKGEARPGRKMGHVTRLLPPAPESKSRAR
ncbi:MAG: 5-(carboxyamino)imidazole ribonucleotide synthase [Pseudomonadota bacterium]